MASASAYVPPGWEEIGRIPFGVGTQIGFQTIGVLLFGAIVALSESVLHARGIVEVFLTTPHAATISLASILATVAAHEGTHGLAALGLGRRPRFGVGRAGILPVAWCSTDAIFPRRAFSLCSLAPLIVLDLLALALLASGSLALVGYAILVANTLGAVADVWGVAYLARYPRGSAVFESKAANLILRKLSQGQSTEKTGV